MSQYDDKMGWKKDTNEDWSARFEIIDQRTRGGPTILAAIVFLVGSIFFLTLEDSSTGEWRISFAGGVVYVAVLLSVCCGLIYYDWKPRKKPD